MEEQKLYMQNRKLITFTCDYCGKEAQKPASEYKRNLAKGRKNFCCRECAAKYNNAHRAPKSISEKDKEHLRSICNNARDEYTPYRYALRCAKRRSKDFNLTLDDLKEVWETQNGTCPYTGIALTLPEDGNITAIRVEERASIDRIDSSKGYIKGNIQFVSTPINYMKSTMSDLQTKEYLKRISSFTSSFNEDKTISSSSIVEEQDAQAGY